MPSAKSKEIDPIAFLIVCGILFLMYLSYWITKQIILLNQTLFKISFAFFCIFLASFVGFLVWGIIVWIQDKDFFGEGSFDGWFSSDPEWYETPLWIFLISLGSLVLLIFIIVPGMNNSYERGYSEEAMKNLAIAQEKLNEYNYIIAVLSGAEIERLLLEGFDESIQEICDTGGYDCPEIIKNYQQIQNIFESKRKADKVASFIGIKK